MPVIRLCYDVPGWAYHQRALALEKYAPDGWDVTTGWNYGAAFKETPHDLVLQLCYPCAQQIREHIQRARYNTKVVVGFNVAFEQEGGWFRRAQQFADWIVCNSKMCWEQSGKQDRTSWISNGVDREVFTVEVPIPERTPRVLWVGSEFHRVNKGYDDILPALAAKLHAEHGIESEFLLTNSHSKSRRRPHEMATWYNTGTIYVCASKREGTPNPALEAASCGCVVVSTPVGNMPELIEDRVNGRLVAREVDALAEAIVASQDNYEPMAWAMQTTIEGWHWKHRAPQYYELFQQVLDS